MAGEVEQRMDSEDLGTLGAMLQLGAEYIEEQDETDEAANVPQMEQAMAIIAGLVVGEVSEVEPPEPDDE